MRVYRSLHEIEEAPEPGRVVAIGVFDGVHRGHQRILAEAIDKAREIRGRSAAVTFYPHPEAVLHPKPAPRMLTSLERKAELIEELGLDELVVVRFDQEFARLSPEAFCRAVLSHRLGACLVLVGENFRFGYQGAGTPVNLQEYGAAHSFVVQPVALAKDDGEIISSTRIRKLISIGNVVEAARLLGRPHRLEGTVVSGAGRGRTLDAPTANLAVTERMAIPRPGVYVTCSSIGSGGDMASVTSIGTNPTFECEQKLHIETLLLDHSGNLYGSCLAVEFLERIRGQQIFPDGASLAARIREDVQFARRFFRYHSLDR